MFLNQEQLDKQFCAFILEIGFNDVIKYLVKDANWIQIVMVVILVSQLD